MTTTQQITNAVCDKFFDLEKQIEEAVIEHEASCEIVETLREALNVAIEQQDETRRKLMELRGSVVTQ